MIKAIDIEKSFDQLKVLDKISFSVDIGKIVSILGPSGAGKSTILRIITGLDKDYKGSFYIKDLSGEEYFSQNRIALVPQKYSNFPWLTVYKNIEAAFYSNNINKNEKKKIIVSLLEEMQLLQFKDYYINQLSGGMQQRVAIARALAQGTDIIALDEPFGALDYAIRDELQMLLKKITIDSKKTILFVTHDIEEAIFISDKIIVLSKRPARILKIIDSNFKHNLDSNVKLSSEFVKLRQEIQLLISTS